MPVVRYLCRQGEPQNIGRYFLRCAHSQGNQCKFFHWEENEPGTQCLHQNTTRTGSNSYVTIIKCQGCLKLLHRVRKVPVTPPTGELVG
jgi:hypothetical protein